MVRIGFYGSGGYAETKHVMKTACNEFDLAGLLVVETTLASNQQSYDALFEAVHRLYEKDEESRKVQPFVHENGSHPGAHLARMEFSEWLDEHQDENAIVADFRKEVQELNDRRQELLVLSKDQSSEKTPVYFFPTEDEDGLNAYVNSIEARKLRHLKIAGISGYAPDRRELYGSELDVLCCDIPVNPQDIDSGNTVHLSDAREFAGAHNVAFLTTVADDVDNYGTVGQLGQNITYANLGRVKHGNLRRPIFNIIEVTKNKGILSVRKVVPHVLEEIAKGVFMYKPFEEIFPKQNGNVHSEAIAAALTQIGATGLPGNARETQVLRERLEAITADYESVQEAHDVLEKKASLLEKECAQLRVEKMGNDEKIDSLRKDAQALQAQVELLLPYRDEVVEYEQLIDELRAQIQEADKKSLDATQGIRLEDVI